MHKLDHILDIKYNGIRPDQGRVLISEPFTADFYFKRSVVLLADHSEEGSFGLIMNKPLNIPFDEVVKGFPKFNGKVFLGGPCKVNTVYYLHRLGYLIDGSKEIIPGLYWGGDAQQISDLILMRKISEEDIMFFVGYAGWSSGQLESELRSNSWVVSSATNETLSTVSHENLWSHLLNRLGKNYSFWKNFPVAPNHN